MEQWDDDEEKSPLNPKLLIGLFVGFFVFIFIAVLFIMVPWLNFQENTDWQAVLIDNAIIIVIGGGFVFGLLMATRIR
jgi:ABC-type Fe3+ transport system permease subunit